MVLFLFNYQICKSLEKQINTKVLSSNIFKKFVINENHPETPDRIEFIKKIVKDSKLKNIYENYEDYKDIENWIELIHSREHIDSLENEFPFSRESFKTCCPYLFGGSR